MVCPLAEIQPVVTGNSKNLSIGVTMKKLLRNTLPGLLIGILLDVLFWFGGPISYNSWITKFLWWVSTPVAHVLSWITGWPLQQESGLALYVYAILITLPLLGILIGITFGIVRKLINRRNDPVEN